MQIVVPMLTDLFSDDIAVTSITQVSTTVTVVTTTPHGLATGNLVTVAGVRLPVVISSLTYVQTLDTGEGVATATTSTNHDLTEGYPDGDNTQVLISGATESQYNGSNRLLKVPNRTNFTYEVQGIPASPATGSPLLNEEIDGAFNGLHDITVVTETMFTFQQSQTFADPVITGASVRCRTRISRAGKDGASAGSISSILESYTKQATDKLWAYVTFGGREVSKDRSTLSDAIQQHASSQFLEQRVIQNYDIYVFVPRINKVSGGAATDLMSDVLPIFTKALLGFSPTTTTSISKPISTLVYTGDNTFTDDSAYYVHQFGFQFAFNLLSGDAVRAPFNRAFRNIDTQKILDSISDTDDVLFDNNIDLDDNPL